MPAMEPRASVGVPVRGSCDWRYRGRVPGAAGSLVMLHELSDVGVNVPAPWLGNRRRHVHEPRPPYCSARHHPRRVGDPRRHPCRLISRRHYTSGALYRPLTGTSGSTETPGRRVVHPLEVQMRCVSSALDSIDLKFMGTKLRPRVQAERLSQCDWGLRPGLAKQTQALEVVGPVVVVDA